MMAAIDPKNPHRSIGERYTSAGNSADLTVDEEHRGDADMLIASGWSMSQLGGALLRLHSEWDAAEHPRKPTIELVRHIAIRIEREDARSQNRQPHAVHALERARAQANAFYLHEVRILMAKLRTLPEARYRASQWCMRAGIPKPGADPTDLVAAVLRRMLDPTCHACFGQRWELVPGTNRHSAKVCRVCRGSGEQPIPEGQVGRRLLVHLEACLTAHAGSMAGRFRHQYAHAQRSA